MLRRFVAFSIPVVILFGMASAVSADVFFSLRATANSPQNPILANVNLADVTGNLGTSFVNQYTTGVTPVVGDSVRSIAAAPLIGYTVNNGTLVMSGGNVFNGSSFGGNSVIAVFAADGSITSVTGGTTVTFAQNSGQLFLFESSAAFNSNDPTTWGITGTSSAVSTVANFIIDAQNNITPGNASANQSSFAANQTNEFTVNAGAGQQAQGRVIFRDGTDPFLVVSDPLLPGFNPVAEGLYGNIQETLVDFGGFGNNTTALDALNAVAALAGLSDLDAVAMGNQAFATGIGAGGPTAFIPNANFSTGDLAFTLGGSLIPGIIATPQVEVPEPASMLVWGVGMGIAGVMGLRRRRNKAKA